MKDKTLKENYKNIIIDRIRKIDDINILIKILTFIIHS